MEGMKIERAEMLGAIEDIKTLGNHTGGKDGKHNEL